MLSGPTSQFLGKGFGEIQKQLIEHTKEGSWQYDSVKLLNECLKIVDSNVENFPIKTQAKNWYSLFCRLRNKTRGHGAIGIDNISSICPLLEKSIFLHS